MVGGSCGRGLGSLVAEEGEGALGTPVREVAVLAALQGQTEDELEWSINPGQGYRRCWEVLLQFEFESFIT